MNEQIGNVILDLSMYPGEDFYSEGSGEDLLLDIVKNNPTGDYNRLIAENANWSTLYHLSDLRGNIADFLPIQKTDKVLEVGAGCGAITGTLAKKAGHVTCIELSKKRSLINAYRNRECQNIDIKVGNFQDIEKTLNEKYDYIMLIGVFEYAASYIDDEKPYERFLQILSEHLRDGGRLIIAIENKYGLKYFAGCKEDHLGAFYSGIEGYHTEDHVRTFSREKLRKLCKDAGFRIKEFYPYPDYKLPVSIYSEEWLPKVGELQGRVPNFDNDRVVAFDEELAFDEIIKENMFQFFSNSFLFVLEKGVRVEGFSVKNPIFSRHSNERAARYAIRTDIQRDGNGKRFVVKYPLKDEAREHIDRLEKSYNMLLEQYKDSVFAPNKLLKLEDGAEFEYIDGQTLSERLIELFACKNSDLAYKLLDEFISSVKTINSSEYVNLDLILSNIIIKDNKYNVIDYEWVVENTYPEGFNVYRPLRYFVLDAKAAGLSDSVDLRGLCNRYGIDENKQKIFEGLELDFQEKIAEGRLSLIGFNSIIGKDALTIDTLLSRAHILHRIDKIKVYYDYGNGFNEDDTCFYTGLVDSNDKVSVEIPLPEGVISLRVDPSDDPCMLKLIKADKAEALINGLIVGRSEDDRALVYYDKPDPQIIFEKIDYNNVIFKLEYVIRAFDKEFYMPIGQLLSDGIKNKKKSELTDIFKKKGPYEKVRI